MINTLHYLFFGEKSLKMELLTVMSPMLPSPITRTETLFRLFKSLEPNKNKIRIVYLKNAKNRALHEVSTR